MTINTDLGRVQYNGNGVTVAFAYSNRVLDKTHLKVVRKVIDTGVETVLTLDSVGADGYAVTGVGGSAATVTVVTAPKLYTDPDGETLTIIPNVPLTQLADYVPNDPFPAETHETALDKLTLISQQQHDTLDRSLKFSETADPSLVPELPEPEDDKILAWDGVDGQMKNGPTTASILDTVAAATAQAVIATTQAGISTTQAGIATSAASTATTAASTATTQAGIATTQATAASAAAQTVSDRYQYDTTITMADPTAGFLRLNNATMASVTAIAISAQSGATGNPNIRPYILTWDDSNHDPRGILRIASATNPGVYVIFGINGANTDNTGWLQLAVSHIASSGTLADDELVNVSFAPSGNNGADGAGSGDVSSNTSSSVDSEVALFSGTGGKTIKRATGTGFMKIISGVLQAAAATISTAEIGDDQVTLAKIANAAANSKLLGSGASGSGANYVELDLGTGLSMSGNTLNASGGSETLLTTLTASNSATLSYTSMSSTYKAYRFRIYDIIPATNATQFQAQGYYSSVLVTANYLQGGAGRDSQGNAVPGEASGSVLQLTATDNLYNSAKAFYIDLVIANPSHTSKQTVLDWFGSWIQEATTRLRQCHIVGTNDSTNPMTGIQFFMSSGNITSGRIDVYGIS